MRHVLLLHMAVANLKFVLPVTCLVQLSYCSMSMSFCFESVYVLSQGCPTVGHLVM